MRFSAEVLRLAPVLGVLCAFSAPASVLAARVIYVDAGATGATDGASWADAYADLQDALAEASQGNACTTESPCEIWVAAGVYKPDRGSGDREATFQMLDNVALYGGFAGGETCLDQRDRVNNETVLTGDLSGNDDPSFKADSDCCRYTFEAGCDNTACQQAVCAVEPRCCDGFPYGWSGNCAIEAMRVCCDLCRGPHCDNSVHVVTASGTAVSAVLDGFTITAGEAGGARPETRSDGGGLFSVEGAPTVTNCTFLANAGSSGTGLFSVYGDPTISDCTFIDNFGYTGGPAMSTVFEDITVRDCTFIANRGSGLSASGSNAIVGCDFIGNEGTGLGLHHGSSVAFDCRFIDNGATGLGGGAAMLVINCIFRGNRSTSGAGGGLDAPFWTTTLLNCQFIGNSAGTPTQPSSGGGALIQGNSAYVANCTFAENSAYYSGGLRVDTLGGVTVTNCIFKGNRAINSTGQYAQLYLTSEADSYAVNYNSIEGWTDVYGGVGNSGDDPLFVRNGYFEDPSTPDDLFDDVWTEGDYHLTTGSPAINAGDPSPPVRVHYDLDGHTRILCDRIDMGAYEFGIGDYDCDDVVDLFDFANWRACMTGPVADPPDPPGCEAFDFNADDAIDLSDFAAFQSILSADNP